MTFGVDWLASSVVSSLIMFIKRDVSFMID